MRKSRRNRLVSVGFFIVSAVCVTTQLQFKSVSAEKQFTEPGAAQVMRAIPATDAEEPSLLPAIQDELIFDTNRLTVDANATFGQEAKLIAPDGAGGDEFGSTVAISGNTAVVGSSFADVDGKADQGVAYVFVRSGSA
ncbi:MAG TPA: FG-GAP repeat protein, partial [Acidobacteriota bacterium]|nr:FG-GAP repeat protein [Acidobacteriota bacterium]